MAHLTGVLVYWCSIEYVVCLLLTVGMLAMSCRTMQIIWAKGHKIQSWLDKRLKGNANTNFLQTCSVRKP